MSNIMQNVASVKVGKTFKNYCQDTYSHVTFSGVVQSPKIDCKVSLSANKKVINDCKSYCKK